MINKKTVTIISGKGILIGKDYDIKQDVICVVLRLPQSCVYITKEDAKWIGEMLIATANNI